jgi:4-hydroxy-tetrahydrodipicolinate synthase
VAGRFGSVVTAMVTPFRDDHGVDLDGAQELASWLTDNGSDSIFVVGSTGESPTLSHKEKMELFRAVGAAIRGKGKLICGTGTYSTAETLDLTQAAEDAGADGIVVVTPYYNKPPQRGLVAHFEHIADSTDLPIIVYNIPSRTGTRIEHDTMLRIAQKPNVVAVKDSTGDFKAISNLISEAPDGFEVYSGDDWATFGYVCLGAVGMALHHKLCHTLGGLFNLPHAETHTVVLPHADGAEICGSSFDCDRWSPLIGQFQRESRPS